MINLRIFPPVLKSYGQKLIVILFILLITTGQFLATTDTSLAAVAPVAPSQQPAERIVVHLGNPTGNLVFDPNHLTLAAGKHYKLQLDNPSPTKHYFTAKDFADSIWTQKVEAGQVEVKGAIHELEIRPGAAAEWVFIPQKPGTYELHCSIPGHAEAGMVGVIDVKAVI